MSAPVTRCALTWTKGLDWRIISQRIYEAYSYMAPERVGVLQGEALEIEPPIEGIDAEEFDPLQRPEIAVVQAMISDLYLVLPDIAPGQQFSTPFFRAGKKNFCPLHFYRSRPELRIWVEGEEQALRTADPRYRTPQ